MQKTFFSYLIIYILFSTTLNSQNLLLKIEGKTVNETEIFNLFNYQKFHKDYLSIKKEVDSVQNKLLKLGYIENELTQIKKINDSVFSTQINLKKKFNNIYIYYNKSLTDSKLISLVSNEIFENYFILKFSEVENALNLLNSKISEKGLPFSKIRLSDIKIKDTDNLSASLIVESLKNKRTINNIVIKGYEKFPQSYIKYFLKIKSDQTFNLNSIRNKSEQLNDLKFASEVKSPEVLFTKDSTTLYLYLKKTKSNVFDGFLGFGTNEETNKLEFNGYLNLNLTNNLNYGESFKLYYKSFQNEQKSFETFISLPYILKSPLGVDLSLRIFKRDSSFSNVNQIAKLHYQFNSKHKFFTGIQSIQSNNLLTQTTSTYISDYKTNYFTFGYEFTKNQSNNLLFPINSNVFFEYNFGNRNQSGLKEKQSLLSVDAYRILNLDIKNSLFLRINSATLVSNSYYENELFRFGGINSIRGFDENSIYASFFGVLNSEYRYQLSNSIYVNSITDLGYFENKLLNTKEKLYGFGFGFGILTKSGLLKLNYANGKTENSKFKLSNSKIHLSLTANF